MDNQDIEAIVIDRDQGRAEMRGLQKDTLSIYLWTVAGFLAFWVILISSPFAPPISVGGGVIISLGIFAYVSSKLQKSSYNISSIFLVFGFMIFHNILVLNSSQTIYLAFGAISIIVGTALMGSFAGLLCGLFSFASSLWLWDWLYATSETPSMVMPLALLYVLVWGSVVIARHPFNEALNLALSGWDRLQTALDEARDRR